MSRLLLALLFLALSFPARAADADTRPPVTDPAQIRDHYHQVLQRPEFQAPDDLDADTRMKDWLSQWFLHLGTKLGEFQYAQEMHSFSLLLMALILILTAVGLLYLSVRFLRRRKSRHEILPAETIASKVFHPPEFYDDEIRRATEKGDWHAAWMVSWRQFLSRLENRRLVEADRTRTNHEYLAQLRRQGFPLPVFALLARMVEAYDGFIYGRRPIDETAWNLFHQQLNEATLLLHLNEKNSRLDASQGAA